MSFKRFLQDLFERVGLAERTPPPPVEADVVVAEWPASRPILARLAVWGVRQIHLLAGNTAEIDDLATAAREAVSLGMVVSVRGTATDLLHDPLPAALAAAGVRRVEMPVLASIAEVHDALAGAGDHRNLCRVIERFVPLGLHPVAQLVLAPSTRKTLERTLEFLDDRRILAIRPFAIVCRDDRPSSWALSAEELAAAAVRIEQAGGQDRDVAWYPPLEFDPARTLAEQVRCGPRAGVHSVRVEPDGRVLPPIGPAMPGGNLLHDDWKAIARSEVFRERKRRRDAAGRCAECPGLKACDVGCLRSGANWATGPSG